MNCLASIARNRCRAIYFSPKLVAVLKAILFFIAACVALFFIILPLLVFVFRGNVPDYFNCLVSFLGYIRFSFSHGGW